MNTVLTPREITMKFITMKDLKEIYGVPIVEIVKSPLTGKLFAVVGNLNIKCQQKIDFSKPIRLMYDPSLSPAEGCIVNVNADNTVMSL